MAMDTGLTPRTDLIGSFPNWLKPRPVGAFSVNAERFYQGDLNNLRYLKVPSNDELPLDLNAGVDSAKRKTENPMDEAIDRLLEYILDNYSELTVYLSNNMEKRSFPLLPVEFVCWRGLLRLIMCTPFEYSDNWIIHITRFKGTHYMCQRETEQAKRKRLNETPLQKRMCSWGYKFEQYCLTKSPEIKPNTNVPVDECSEFACVFNTRIEGCNLLYGAEMDGIKSQKPINITNKMELSLEKLEFVELKTSVQISNEKQSHSYSSFKSRNWWCQAFLVGIEDIIVGWRDNYGLVQKIQEIKVNQLPKQRKNWSPSHCGQFLVAFLNCVKSLMSEVNCPYTVYEFKYDARNSRITYEIFKGSTEKSFLAEYYIYFMERQTKVQE